MRLRIHYLRNLPPGYMSSAEVFDENEAPLAKQVLTRDGPGAELVIAPLPPVVAAGLPAGPKSTPAAPAPVPLEETASHELSTPFISALALIVGAIGMLILRRMTARLRLRLLTLLFALLVCLPAQAQRQMERLGRGIQPLLAVGRQQGRFEDRP